MFAEKLKEKECKKIYYVNTKNISIIIFILNKVDLRPVVLLEIRNFINP